MSSQVATPCAVPLNAPTFNDDEINAAIAVLQSGQVTMSTRCLAFEEKFSKYMHISNAVFVNSGSSANLLAFFGLINPQCPMINNKQRVTPGDEVIVPAVTWSTTIWPIIQAGLVPVFVDCDPHTLQMRPESVKKALSSRTKVVCPVHVLGNGVNMDFILNFSDENKLWVVEDTCESLGTQYNTHYLGTLGDIGTYSFFFSHHITTIEGGMIVSNHEDLAELFRCQRAHGWIRQLKNKTAIENKYPDIDSRFLFVNTGFNLRPTEINAAFGLLQLDKLKIFNLTRADIANTWTRAFTNEIENQYFTPMQITPNITATWFGYPILCRDQSLRIQLQSHLENNGIETRPIICGNIARQPVFQSITHRIPDILSGADKIMKNGLFWGSHPFMTKTQINHVIEVVKGFFQ
ncbi:MAG: hypothetical protein A3F11_08415 [Gammaproteobacteria bacterium RIFCSPHIGHO2_12_FULL_37_14]|nr:MAG: hypothetical protein A3F11_08415 [Gammaproteobacteria bacterium RIFCSPHIGHO2_12_FULL_37_14]